MEKSWIWLQSLGGGEGDDSGFDSERKPSGSNISYKTYMMKW